MDFFKAQGRHGFQLRRGDPEEGGQRKNHCEDRQRQERDHHRECGGRQKCEAERGQSQDTEGRQEAHIACHRFSSEGQVKTELDQQQQEGGHRHQQRRGQGDQGW